MKIVFLIVLDILILALILILVTFVGTYAIGKAFSYLHGKDKYDERM